MAPSTPEELLLGILRRIEEINRVAPGLTGTDRAGFAPISLDIPKQDPPELGFILTVSWLFVLYYEAGRVEAAFLSKRLTVYEIDLGPDIADHPQLVRAMRTYLQHNLDSSKASDRATKSKCEAWLDRQCGTPVPGGPEHWAGCLRGLLCQALEFVGALLQVVRRIEQDESREEICREWVFRIERYHPPHQFEVLISEVAADMGRDNIDPVQLRTRFYNRWTGELSLLGPGYDFEVEARKLIEYALLTLATPVLPITGKDIIEVLGVAPGPEIGRLLDRAHGIYRDSPCSRETLLERLTEGPG